jgi:hypothetical protein
MDANDMPLALHFDLFRHHDKQVAVVAVHGCCVHSWHSRLMIQPP